jgi:hypothetical protein
MSASQRHIDGKGHVAQADPCDLGRPTWPGHTHIIESSLAVAGTCAGKARPGPGGSSSRNVWKGECWAVLWEEEGHQGDWGPLLLKGRKPRVNPFSKVALEEYEQPY